MAQIDTKALPGLISGATKHRLIQAGERGLYLDIHPSRTEGAPNRASFVYRYFQGRAYTVGLGEWPARSPADARRLALNMRTAILDGRNPRDVLKPKGGPVTFRDALDAFKASPTSAYPKAGNGKHLEQWANTLDAAAKHWAKEHTVRAITGGMVSDYLETLAPETARRVRARLEHLFDYCEAKGWTTPDSNPATRKRVGAVVKKANGREKNGHPWLPYARVGAFWQALQSDPGVAARALSLVMLTACRSQEARLATWSMYDAEKATLTLPSSLMKMRGGDHVIPLSPAAVALIDAMKERKHKRSDFIFPSLGGKPLTSQSLQHVIARMNDGKKHWVAADGRVVSPHGFRKSFSSWAAAETAHDADTVEMALAHTVKGVRGAYQMSDLLAKRQALMTDWAAYVTAG